MAAPYTVYSVGDSISLHYREFLPRQLEMLRGGGPALRLEGWGSHLTRLPF